MKVKIWVVLYVCMCVFMEKENMYMYVYLCVCKTYSTYSYRDMCPYLQCIWRVEGNSVYHLSISLLFFETRPFTGIRDSVTGLGWRAINSQLSACFHLPSTGSRMARPGVLSWILAMGLRSSNTQQAEIFILNDHLTVFVADVFYVNYM